MKKAAGTVCTQHFQLCFDMYKVDTADIFHLEMQLDNLDNNHVCRVNKVA